MREAVLIESDRKGFIVGSKQTFYDALTKYKDEVPPNKKGARWVSYRINFFIETIPFIGELITNIKPTNFVQWCDTRLKQVMTSTVNKESSIMSSVFVKATTSGGFVRMYTPKKTAVYEKLVADMAGIAIGSKQALKQAVVVPINVYLPIPKSKPKKWQESAICGAIVPTVKPDIDNLAKSVLDGINGIVFEDDKQVAQLIVNK